MLELVKLGIVALRAAYIADNQKTDGELLTAAFVGTDEAEDASLTSRMKATVKSSEGTPRKLFRAAIWCMRNGSTDITAGWTAIGLDATGFDPGVKSELNGALTP